MKRFLSLLALVAMMCIPTQSWAAQVTFKFVYNGSAITSGLDYNTSVSLYKNGEQIASGNVQSYGESAGTASIYVEDNYVGENVVYMSSLGHQGTLSVKAEGVSIDLEMKKLTVTTKNKEGSPLTNQNVYIYDSNNKSYSIYTDYQYGTGSTYLPTGSYTYAWRGSYSDTQASGSFDLTNDYELNLVSGESPQEPSTEYTLKFVCRNGDYPVNFSMGNSFYIYRYGEKNSYVTSASISSSSSSSYSGGNSGSVRLSAGSYWIKDPYDTFSQRIDLKENMTTYLDYHKVTFVSKTGNTPNVGQTISLRNNSSSVTTNANGEATVYRMAGEYTYTVAGYKSDFTVGESDQTVNINTSKVTISLSCDDMSALNTQLFEWGTDNNNNNYDYYTANYSTVTATDGKITITTLPGNYTLRVNGISTVSVNVNEGENNVSVKLYSLKFTTNLSTNTLKEKNNINVFLFGNNGSYKQVGFDATYYLPAGDYKYNYNVNSSISSPSDTPITLNSNKVIELDFGKVTITVKDTNGEAASGISVSATGAVSSAGTDANGQAILIVPYGTITISVSGYESKVVNVTGDVDENFTIPGFVTFNVLENGEPYNGYSLRLYKDDADKSIDAYMVSAGVCVARIASGENWNINKYKGSIEISEGCTVSFGTLTVGSEGMGVAFPMEEWSNTTASGASKFKVIVGATVRLTAIPVKDDGFQCWVINGNEVASPAIDLEIADVNTVATAVFEGAAPNVRVARGDVNQDGEVNVGDLVKVTNIMSGNE